MTRVQWRRGTAAQWSNVNPVLASGEVGLETDSGKFKLGDGTSAWNTLPYTAPTWTTIAGKPAVVAAGATQSDARAAIGAGTSSLVLGTTSTTAKVGDYTPTSSEVTTALGFTPENAARKGQPNGYASLDGAGLVPSAQLPSYVDDVVEVANFAGLPAIGETSKIYTTLNDNKIFRWGGSAYIEVSPSPGSTDNVAEGSTNLYFTNARAQNALTTQLAGKTDVGHTHVQSDVTGLSISLAGKANTSHTHAQADITNLTTDLAGKVPTTRTVNNKALSADVTLTQDDIGDGGTNKAFTATDKTRLANTSGTNTGDQSSIVGITGTTAQFNTALSDNDFATLAGTEVLTHKSISGADNTFSAIPQSAVTSLTTDLAARESAANKGQPSGYAALDSSGLVPANQLPSFVDDVVEYATLAGMPGTGETGKIYVDLSTNKVYRWSGSVYVEISPSPGSTDNVAEGSTNLYFTAARAQAALTTQLAGKEPTIASGTSGQYWAGTKTWATLDKTAVGLANVDNTSDASKPVSSATQMALDGKQATMGATAVKTGTYNAAVNELIPCDATSAGFAVNLPAAPADRSRVTVKKIDSSTNLVTLTCGGSDKFNSSTGATTRALTLQNEALTAQYNSGLGVWYVTSADVPLAGLDTRHQLTSAKDQANGYAGLNASSQLTQDTTGKAAGLTASTSNSIGVGSIELGHASDTTVTRSAAGTIAVEGADVLTTSSITPGNIDNITNYLTTIPRFSSTTSQPLYSGTLHLTYFTPHKTLAATKVVSNTGGNAAGATPTICRIGIYSVDGSNNLTLIGSMANDTTMWASTYSTYTKNLSATTTLTAGSRYAIGALIVTAAAAPVLNSSPAVLLPTVSPRLIGSVTSQSDLPASISSASIGLVVNSMIFYGLTSV